MNSIPQSQLPEKRSDMPECKHPRVQIVAREEDAEFVEAWNAATSSNPANSKT